MSGPDCILPFLRPIEDLHVDPDITEVMVNAAGRRVERNRMPETVPDRTLETRNLAVAIKNFARACGDKAPSSRVPVRFSVKTAFL